MDHGKIENGFYVQGDLKFAVDTANAHKTFDAVQALSNPDKIKLAKLNGVQTEPFNKNLLTTILKSIVQNAWFANRHNGVIPAEVLAGHNGRLATYTAAIALPTSDVDFLSKKKRAESKTHPTLMFTLDEQKYESVWRDWRNQRYLVIKSMLELKATTGTPGASIKSIADNCKETRENNCPNRNAVGQIINKLVAAGIVTLLNPRKKPVETPTPKPEPTKPAPQPTKKKH